MPSSARIIAKPGRLKVNRPSGGYVLWVEMPAGIDSIELYQRALKERIGISPGPMFSASNRYRNCLRINCGIAWSDRAERALAQALDAKPSDRQPGFNQPAGHRVLGSLESGQKNLFRSARYQAPQGSSLISALVKLS